MEDLNNDQHFQKESTTDKPSLKVENTKTSSMESSLPLSNSEIREKQDDAILLSSQSLNMTCVKTNPPLPLMCSSLSSTSATCSPLPPLPPKQSQNLNVDIPPLPTEDKPNDTLLIHKPPLPPSEVLPSDDQLDELNTSTSQVDCSLCTNSILKA